MINYRNIFNPNYNYIGIIIIILLALIIVVVQKDTIESIRQISKTFFLSGIIILIIAMLLNFIIEFLIVSSYKVFVEIITKNVISNLYFYSITILIIGAIINLLVRILTNSKKIAL